MPALAGSSSSCPASLFVWVKLASAEEDSFAKVRFNPGSDLGDLAGLACKEFTHWRLNAAQLRLHPAAEPGQEVPSSAAIQAALLRPHLVVTSAVQTGAWLVAAGSAGPSDSFDVSAAISKLRIDILSALTQDAATTVLSDAEYEGRVRTLLPGLLLQRCGLETVAGVDTQRHAFLGFEWDFSAPVTLAQTAPHSNADADFTVFPSKPHYMRPLAVQARYVTPTKFGGAAEPPAAHYLAIVEATVAPKWTRASSSRSGLLERLEQRLHVTLDRAVSQSVSGVTDITDLVAVVGVAAPCEYSMSVCDLMSAGTAPPLLKKLMEAGRFAFFRVPQGSS